MLAVPVSVTYTLPSGPRSMSVGEVSGRLSLPFTMYPTILVGLAIILSGGTAASPPLGPGPAPGAHAPSGPGASPGAPPGAPAGPPPGLAGWRACSGITNFTSLTSENFVSL